MVVPADTAKLAHVLNDTGRLWHAGVVASYGHGNYLWATDAAATLYSRCWPCLNSSDDC